MNTPTLVPRVDTSICVTCRKPFAKGDRVQIAHIVIDTGRNPAQGNIPGAWLSEEFELVHVSCIDVGLHGRILHK